MNAVDIVVMLAIAQYLYFAGLVGKARTTYGVKAPAIAGHELFERVYRVQMNTLELLVAFVPVAYAAVRYLPAWVVPVAGAVYLVGRDLYARAYVAEPSTRSLGFALSIAPVALLMLAVLVAAVIGAAAA